MSLLEQLVSQCSVKNIYYSLIDDLQQSKPSTKIVIQPLLNQNTNATNQTYEKDNIKAGKKKLRIKYSQISPKDILSFKKTKAINSIIPSISLVRNIRFINFEVIPPSLQHLTQLKLSESESQPQLNDYVIFFMQLLQFSQENNQNRIITPKSTNKKISIIPALKINAIKQYSDRQTQINLIGESRQRHKNQSILNLPIKVSIRLSSPNINSNPLRYKSQINKQQFINTNRTEKTNLRQIKLSSPISICRNKITLNEMLQSNIKGKQRKQHQNDKNLKYQSHIVNSMKTIQYKYSSQHKTMRSNLKTICQKNKRQGNKGI